MRANDNINRIDEFFKDLIPKEVDKWVSLIYTKQVEVIKDYIYPNSIKQLRPGIGKDGVKMPEGPKYVVIHDTGMTHDDDDADGLNRYIHAQANSEEGRVASWHLSIDDKKAYQHIPTDEIGWHAGDGTRAFGETKYNASLMKYDIGGGNQNGIGIETCINPDNDYELTLKRTAKLTASLLYQYELGLDRVKKHYDFSGKICPNVILNSKGLWEVFIKDVEAHLLLAPYKHEIKWENSHPNIIKESGEIITPIVDTMVNLKLFLTIENIERVYEYKLLVKGLPEKKRIEKTFYEIYHNLDLNNLPKENKNYNTNIVWNKNDSTVFEIKTETSTKQFKLNKEMEKLS